MSTTGETTGEWTTEQREPGWFGRLIAPQGGGRPATFTFVLGALGAGAFIGSLAINWQSITVPTGAEDIQQPSAQHFGNGIASIDTLSLVYTLGVVGLLGIVGAVVTRPDLALRLRMAAAGVTVGLVGVLVAVTVRLSDTVVSFPTYFGLSAEQLQLITISYEPGIFCGYAAVVLPGVAIWRAGRVARLREGDAGTDGGAGAGDGVAGAEPSRWRARVAVEQGATGLGVSFSDPLDLSVGPGDASLQR